MEIALSDRKSNLSYNKTLKNFGTLNHEKIHLEELDYYSWSCTRRTRRFYLSPLLGLCKWLPNKVQFADDASLRWVNGWTSFQYSARRNSEA